MSGELEAMVLELRRWKPYWGPHSLVLELARRKVASLPSESRVYRCREGLALPVRAPAAGLPVFPAGGQQKSPRVAKESPRPSLNHPPVVPPGRGWW